MKRLLDEVRRITEEVIETCGFDLVDVVLGNSKRMLIRVFIDKPGGTSIKDCASVSKMLMERFDQELWEIDQYRLEVSSPGLDRPLKTSRDFMRHIGKEITVVVREGDREIQLNGKIISIDQNILLLGTGETQRKFSLEQIIRAKQKLKW